MDSLNDSSAIAQSARPETRGRLRCLARQAILDASGHIHAYDLLLRNGPESIFQPKGEQATRSILDQTVVHGMDVMTGGLPAFVLCTEQTLSEDLVEVMMASMTVLELPAERKPGSELIAVLRSLKAEGFRLALNRFWWEPRFAPLLELADYLKVDFNEFCTFERGSLHKHLRHSHPALIASNLETQEEFRRARSEGFALYQGNYICRPELLRNRAIPPNRVAQIQTLSCLQSSPLDLRELSVAVKRDTSLSYRFLRMVNSSLFAMRHEVTSIDAALILVGQDVIQRIVTLALASELNLGGSPVILLLSLTRARFCEQAASLYGQCSTEQYMLGMLSLLPVMLRVDMGDLTPELPLRSAIREALHGVDNKERVLLTWLESWERGDWEECDGIAKAQGLRASQLADIYTAAVHWADMVVQSAK